MENLSNETLFYSKDYEYLLWAYNKLFSIFKNTLWTYLKQEFEIDNDAEVIGIERWLWNAECQIFWDYLWASHGAIENIFWSKDGLIGKNFTYRCVKLKFKNKKSVIISTNANPNKLPHGVVSLDECYMNLNSDYRQIFDKIFFSLNKFESQHFTSSEFQYKFGKIKISSKDQLCQILNLNELNI
jgi:hypothetical protein